MLLHILGPNGCFLRNRCNPSSFENEFKLFLYFPLPGLFWNAAPNRCSPPSRQGCSLPSRQATSAPEGLGLGTQSCWFPVSPPPSRISTTLVGANCQGKHRLSPESTAANTPELEAPQIPSPSSSSIKQVHYADSSRSCAEVKEPPGRGAEAPLTSTGSSPRASLHQLTLSPCGIRRNKPFELRAW